MQDVEWAAERFALLGRYLKDAGEGGLRRNLQKQISEAAKPLARKISNVDHLKPYMPDRYALVLSADLTARVSQRFASGNPGVMIRVQARERKRKVARLDRGTINHPVYARGPRDTWTWSNYQTGGMKAGFFTDACEQAAPQIRSKVMQALAETERAITEGG
jgi:hypothetical protein